MDAQTNHVLACNRPVIPRAEGGYQRIIGTNNQDNFTYLAGIIFRFH